MTKICKMKKLHSIIIDEPKETLEYHDVKYWNIWRIIAGGQLFKKHAD